MSNWKTRYAHKVTDAATALENVKRGQRIFIGSGAAVPMALVTALVARAPELADIDTVHLLTLSPAPYAAPNLKDVFRHNALFIGENVRQAVTDGRADFTPIFLSEIPRLFQSRRLPLDVALIQVSEPDRHGFCSYGLSVDIVKSAAESADLVIAEINPRMPRTHGDSFIHVDAVACLVESDAPLITAQPAQPDETARQIGRHVADLIDNGSTLQLGIGSIPNAVLEALKDHRGLGIHTEMFSDGIIDLIDCGAITCAEKSFRPDKAVTSFCFGSEKLYGYVHDNPFFDFRPSEFTNDPFTISRNRKMVAINAALEVDLTGQVCADSIGARFFSGIGGQVDFIRGAARSEGGKPIIVLPSTAQGGKVSRIVPHISEGGGVVTTRGDVHYVVTEYGVADLWGRNARERALALISIAHPDFRDQLLEEAKRRRLIYQDQIFTTAHRYPTQWVREKTLRDGTRVTVRPVRPTDEPLVKDLFYSLSEETIYQRFFRPVKKAPHSMLQQLVNVDYVKEMALVVVIEREANEEIVGMGRYVQDPATRLADTGFEVRDDYQNRGIGTLLIEELIEIAKVNGIPGFTADVLASNSPMLRLFHKYAKEVRSSVSLGVTHLEMRFGKER